VTLASQYTGAIDPPRRFDSFLRHIGPKCPLLLLRPPRVPSFQPYEPEDTQRTHMGSGEAALAGRTDRLPQSLTAESPNHHVTFLSRMMSITSHPSVSTRPQAVT